MGDNGGGAKSCGGVDARCPDPELCDETGDIERGDDVVELSSRSRSGTRMSPFEYGVYGAEDFLQPKVGVALRGDWLKGKGLTPQFRGEATGESGGR